MALTKYNFNSFDVTSAASKALGFNSSANGFATISPGSMTLIKTLTASSDSTLSFVNGSSDVVLDSTYPVYLFKYINCHPSTDSGALQVNFRDGGSSYDASKTTTSFQAQHTEADSTQFTYETDFDLANGTGFQYITRNTGNDNDQSVSGELFLFNPSSTTFVKHFFSRCNSATDDGGDMSLCAFSAGYANTTSAITSVRFKMVSGTLDSGTIKMYGVS